jgi:hypothetical protein
MLLRLLVRQALYVGRTLPAATAAMQLLVAYGM